MPTPRRRAARGFTLIELMMVVGIIGVLSSVAIPTFMRLTLRTRTAERATVMNRVKAQIQDHYVRNGSVIDAIVAPDNPPLASLGTAKRMMDATLPGWRDYFNPRAGSGRLIEEIEGAVYYSYSFATWEAGGASGVAVQAIGDLDGDGIQTSKLKIWTRQSGVYQLVSEVPPEGLEDDGTFGSF